MVSTHPPMTGVYNFCLRRLLGRLESIRIRGPSRGTAWCCKHFNLTAKWRAARSLVDFAKSTRERRLSKGARRAAEKRQEELQPAPTRRQKLEHSSPAPKPTGLFQNKGATARPFV